MSAALTFPVYGTPGPQGSKTPRRSKAGKLYVQESSAKVKPWRQDVKHAALDAIRHHEAVSEPLTLTGPVHLSVTFLMPRIRAHYGTGKNADVLKPGAPDHHHIRPDVDKLLRSTMDALGEAGVWRDDAQVALVTAEKRYTNGTPGAHIVVRAVRP